MAHFVDKHVGQRLRLKRSVMGMSQADLGHKVGITFQQVQKYERGNNRISSSRLYEFAKILGVKVEYFFEDCEVDESYEEDAENLPSREAQKLLKYYEKIQDQKAKKQILQFVKGFVEE